jgi:hypothetical protein
MSQPNFSLQGRKRFRQNLGSQRLRLDHFHYSRFSPTVTPMLAVHTGDEGFSAAKNVDFPLSLGPFETEAFFNSEVVGFEGLGRKVFKFNPFKKSAHSFKVCS